MKVDTDDALVRSAVSFVDLGHCELAYRRVGAGPPLILVHGYPLSGMTFRYLVPDLAEHFTCYVPDLPGLGETRWTDRTDFMFAAQAETLKAFIDALHLPAYAVVAHDTGGTIARRLAVIDRDRLICMALIGTEIPGHRPPWIPLFQKIVNPKQTGTFKFLMGQRWFRHSSAAFGGCFADRSLIEGEFWELMLKPMLADERRIRGQTHYLMGIDWTLLDALKIDHAKITAPVLLVWGEDDPVFPVEEARPMAAQLANCAGFVIVPRGKLFVHEEMPDIVLPILLDFLLRETERDAPANDRGDAGNRSAHDDTAARPIASSQAQPTRPASPRTSPQTSPASHPLLDAGATMMLLILVGGFILPALAWVAWGHPIAAQPVRSFELRMLIWSALLSLTLPILQIGAEIRRSGGPAVRGNRDFYPRAAGFGARLSRAHANAIESLPPFAAVVLAAHAFSVSNRWTVAASALYLAARMTHAATYAIGVTIIRSAAFYAGWVATVTIAATALRLTP